MSGAVVRISLGAAAALLLAGCGKPAADVAVTNGQPSHVAVHAEPIQTPFARDPSVPDASVVFAAQDAADKAMNAKAASAPAAAATPQKQMTDAEESKSMPMAGQANNHSTPAPAKAAGN
jgi:hypothetical protein